MLKKRNLPGLTDLLPTLFSLLFLAPSFANTLTLEQAMELAEKASYEKKIADLAVSSLATRKMLSHFNLGPSLQASASSTWADANINKGARHRPWQGRAEDVVLSLEQPLTDLTKQILSLKSQTALYESATFERDAVRIASRIQGATAFVNAQKALRVLKIRQEALHITQQSQKDGEVFFKTGTKTKADLLQLDVALAQAQFELQEANAARNHAFLVLANVIGQDDIPVLDTEDMSFWERQKKQDFPEKPDMTLMLAQRPNLQGLSLKIRSAQLEKYKETFDFFPKIPATVTWNYNPLKGPEFDSKTGLLLYPAQDVNQELIYGFSLSWNIWDRGVREAQRSVINADLRRVELERERAVKAAKLSLSEYTYRLKSKRESLNIALKAQTAAQEALKQSEVQYKTGNLSVYDFINAQKSLHDAKIKLADTRSELDLSWLQLQSEMGQVPTIND